MYTPASNNIWKNPSAHLVRSAVGELQQNKKKQPQQQQEALSSKNTNNRTSNGNKTNNNKPAAESTCSSSSQNSNKKVFSSYHFYLDNIDNQAHSRLTKRLTILGANIETFFSKKCTHVITSKPEAGYNKEIEQENIPPSINSNKRESQAVTHRHTKEDIVDKAKKMDIQVWRLDKAMQIISTRFDASQNKRKQLEKKILGKVYQDDKRFGPSTSTKDQARRPQFVEFTGHYLIVEDIAKVHRPAIIKQYSREMLDKGNEEFPWPFLKNIPGHKSPFHKDPKNEPTTQDAKKEQNNYDDQHQTTAVTNKEKCKEKIGDDVLQPVTPLTKIPDTTHSITTIHNNNNNNDNNTDASPHAVITTPNTSIVSESLGGGNDFQLCASGFQLSIPNSQPTLRCVSGLMDSQSRTLNADNNGKRTIEKLSKKEAHLPQQHEKEQQQKQNDPKLEFHRKKQQQHQQLPQQEQKQRKEELQNNEKLCCENCNVRFTHFSEHVKSESHQAFIRDQNNYKKLDQMLATVQRQYKTSLSEDMHKPRDTKIDSKIVKSQSGIKRSSEFAVDMTDIQAPCNKILKYASETTTADISHPICIEDGHHQQEGWGKYYGVFL